MYSTLLALGLVGVISAAINAQAAQTPPRIGLAASHQRSYAQMKRFLLSQAERMPESDYAFRPSPDVRTFGQLVGHVADYNYVFCAPARGGVNPRAGTTLEHTATKAGLIEALAASFAFCDEAFAALTDENAMDPVQQGQNTVTRAGSLIPVLVHGYEEYGYAAVYARIRGVVPPSTAP
jgi:uncharacterized damage-inducible protein DinB